MDTLSIGYGYPIAERCQSVFKLLPKIGVRLSKLVFFWWKSRKEIFQVLVAPIGIASICFKVFDRRVVATAIFAELWSHQIFTQTNPDFVSYKISFDSTKRFRIVTSWSAVHPISAAAIRGTIW